MSCDHVTFPMMSTLPLTFYKYLICHLPIPVEDDDLGMIITVMVLLECLLPGRPQILDRGLAVELARKEIEELWVKPAQVCEPILVTQSEFIFVFLLDFLHFLWADHLIIETTGPHSLQVEEDDSGIESLLVTRETQG